MKFEANTIILVGEYSNTGRQIHDLNMNIKEINLKKIFIQIISSFLSPFLRNFFLCQDRLSGDVPPHLAQPCYIALGWALIWGLYPDELRLESFVNWVSSSQVI